VKNKNTIRGLGSALIDDKSYIFVCSCDDANHGKFTVRESGDGIVFKTKTSNAKVVNINGPSDNFDDCSFFHVSKDGKNYYLTYRLCGEKQLCVARSKNLIDWEKRSSLELKVNGAKIVSEYLYAGRNIMYSGGDALRLYVSENFETWKRTRKDLIVLDDYYDELLVMEAQVVEDGVFVLYAKVMEDSDSVMQYELYGALFDYGDPTKLLWQSKVPIYKTENTKNKNAILFGAVLFDDYFVSYWTNDDEMFLIRHFYEHGSDVREVEDIEDIEDIADEQVEEEAFELERSELNPIMEPRTKHGYTWESQATYNPTAIESDGMIHIIYRADGDDMMSVWGYASTVDGVTIKDRSTNCIYQRKTPSVKMQFPPPVSYTSGNNGNGGCEDPRAVLIDGTVYVTFTAFDGWGSVRVGLTSIDFMDFKNKKWNWKETTLISPPGEINKNWVIFPDKIGGKFAIMHSFVPNILIDYFDSLDELDGHTFIKSNNTRPIDPSRKWDSWFRGVGPAPLKTSDGWLVFYHAMDHNNPDRYRLGALLLDLEDPTRELCRSHGPILEPEEYYENDGHKWGVIYSCGAVIKDDQIFVYYGGADKFVCVATAPLKQFLDNLKQNTEFKMVIN